jgi:hypothetical protein
MNCCDSRIFKTSLKMKSNRPNSVSISSVTKSSKPDSPQDIFGKNPTASDFSDDLFRYKSDNETLAPSLITRQKIDPGGYDQVRRIVKTDLNVYPSRLAEKPTKLNSQYIASKEAVVPPAPFVNLTSFSASIPENSKKPINEIAEGNKPAAVTALIQLDSVQLNSSLKTSKLKNFKDQDIRRIRAEAGRKGFEDPTFLRKIENVVKDTKSKLAKNLLKDFQLSDTEKLEELEKNIEWTKTEV